MKKQLFVGLAVGLTFLGIASFSHSEIMDFSGGSAYINPERIKTYKDGLGLFWPVDFYVEGGFKLDFINAPGHIGTFYGGTNDVMHAHFFSTGPTLTEIKVSKVDGALFDLNYFEITSNTRNFEHPASGEELAYITGYNADGSTSAPPMLLPPNDWGLKGPNSQIFLGSAFDEVSWVSFTVDGGGCLGLDMLSFNEPSPVPEPATMILFGTGIAGLTAARRRKKKAC